jgi:phosphate uptake regulator
MSPAASAEEVTPVADQHTVRAYDKDLDLLERRIAEMGGLAEKMVIDAVDALSSGDTVLAHQVVETDPRLDLLQREIEEQATEGHGSPLDATVRRQFYDSDVFAAPLAPSRSRDAALARLRIVIIQKREHELPHRR